MLRSKGKLKPKGIKRKAGLVVRHKRRKKGEITKLKAKLWALCRDIQIKQYGNTCYTCGAKDLKGANLHLGHFITSSLCSVEMRFHLENLRPQDYRCNIHLSGNWPAFETHLIQEGKNPQTLKDRNEATKGVVYPKQWFLDKITEYTKLLEIVV